MTLFLVRLQPLSESGAILDPSCFGEVFGVGLHRVSPDTLWFFRALKGRRAPERARLRLRALERELPGSTRTSKAMPVLGVQRPHRQGVGVSLDLRGLPLAAGTPWRPGSRNTCPARRAQRARSRGAQASLGGRALERAGSAKQRPRARVAIRAAHGGLLPGSTARHRVGASGAAAARSLLPPGSGSWWTAWT